MMIQPTLFKDFYKAGHIRQYPDGTQYVYSNFTPRISRLPFVNKVVVFGINGFIQEFLVERFNRDFFDESKDTVIRRYERRMGKALGLQNSSAAHISDLHDLGYLPLEIKALPEGTLCPLKTPVLTIKNTKPNFAWLTNDIETMLSCQLWHPMTVATIAYNYRKTLDKYAAETSDIPEFVEWQGHDFSMRGSTSVESACRAGAAHLLSFKGTDTIPAIDYLEQYYGAGDSFVGGSVPATEHAVMCLGGKETEEETFVRLMKAYPTGILSVVSDTWDLWSLITKTLPKLKDRIMHRDGKLVIRPDSGDPVLILCGDPSAKEGSPEYKGVVELLWEIFGGRVNDKGFKQLDEHIGTIYGDSITLERCNNICFRLAHKGFASTNVVFGIGSYTYQYVTRDTFGFAMKATWGQINGIGHNLFKAPKTDSGFKNSATGLLRVNEDLTLSENVSEVEESGGMLKTVFYNGDLINADDLETIRKRLLSNA